MEHGLTAQREKPQSTAVAEERRLDAALCEALDDVSGTLAAAPRRRRLRRRLLTGTLSLLIALLVVGLWDWQRTQAAGLHFGEDAVDALAAKGWDLFKLGRYQPALAAFRQALAASPRHVAARRGLGWSLLNSGEWTAARRVFEAVLRDVPNDPACLNGLGRSLHWEQRYPQAIAAWQTMVDLYPGVHGGVSGLAEVYLQLDDCAAALPYLEMLRREYGELSWVAKGLARCSGQAHAASS